MYAPHTVTVYRGGGKDRSITILEGVFLDMCRGTNLMKSGLVDADAAVLFIPDGCKATDALTGQEQRYCPPKEYGRLEDKAGFWTVGTGGRQSGVDCFFVKGVVVEPEAGFAEINDRFDGVFRVSSVDVRDFGSMGMHHLQVGGK